MSRTRITAAAMLLFTLVVTGCAGDPMPTPSPSPSPTPTPQGPFGDGQLRIGTLVPMTGAEAGTALSQVAGVELAVREINEAGGFAGAPVLAFHRNSGDADADILETSFAELVELGVDVIIGPSSVDLARRLVPLAADAGVMVISPSIGDPAAAAIGADGLFARTLPSAVHDGAGIAAHTPPRARVAVVYFSDSAGRGVRDTLADALPAAGASLVATVALTPSMRKPDRVIDAITAAGADTVVYAGSASRSEQNTLMLTALAETESISSLWLTSTVATRHEVEPGLLEGALTVTAAGATDAGFTARLRSADPRATILRYGVEAYDATIVAALAAVAADDGGRAIAHTIAAVSADGIPCRSWEHCLHVLDTSAAWDHNIDYEGQSGSLDFDTDLAAKPSTFSVLVIDADNTPRPAP